MYMHFDHSFVYQSCLLDTGAGISLIDRQFVKDFPLHTDRLYNLKGLGSSETLGYVSLKFWVVARTDGCWQDLVFTHEFHVVEELAPGVILGSDFVFGYELNINGRNKVAQLTLGEQVFSWRIWPLQKLQERDQTDTWTVAPSSQPKPEATMIASRDITIPARHHCWVPVHPSRTLQGPLLSISPAAWTEKSSDVFFLIAGAVVSSKLSHILVTNVGTADGIVASNFPLCQAYPLEDATSCAIPTGQVFTLDHTIAPMEVDLSRLDDCDVEPFKATDDEFDNANKEQLVAESTTLIDNYLNVGSASTPEILEVLRSYKDVFSLDGKPGHVRGFPMRIPLEPEAQLRPEGPRRMSPLKRSALDTSVDTLLEQGIIEPSSSPTSYPVLLVRQGQKWRMCVDYRALNSVTISDRYPLPRMEDVFECLSSGRVFSCVDAVSGYFQLDIAEEDRYKTAFVCHRGLFQFTRIPFGLKNAPSHFQRFMDTLLGSMRWKSAMVYIDDAVVFSATVEEHAKHLTELFKRCRQFGLKLSPKKCFFAVTSLNLLGRLVTVDGISIIPDRAAAVRDLQAPKTLQDVYHLLGFFNYYRDFIPRFAHLAAPLTAKTKGAKYRKVEGTDRHELIINGDIHRSAKTVPVECGEKELAALASLKDALCRQVVLAFPNRDLPWFLYVDASKEGYAAALHQQFERPLLKDINKKQEADSVIDTNQVLVIITELPPAFGDAAQIAQQQRDDPLWNRILLSFERGEPVKGYAISEGVLVYINDDTICLPKSLQHQALEDAHQGHFGGARTYMRIASRFFHPSLPDLVRAWVKWCPTCIRTKLVRRVGRLDIDDAFLGIPFHTISMDLMLGLPGPKDACLIILDVFSKMVFFHPMTSKATAMSIAHAFENMVLRRGWRPSRIISDSDTRFIGSVARAIASRLGVTLTPSAPYHQSANPVERYVQTAKQALIALSLDQEPSKWPDRVAALELSMNNAVSTVTKFSPFDPVYVQRPNLVGKLLEHSGVGSIQDRFHFSQARLQQASRAIATAREKQKARFDERHRDLPDFKEGDLVMVSLRDRLMDAGRQAGTKLDPPLEGPFRIKRVLSDHRVELDLPPDMKTKQPFDVSHLKHVPPAAEDPFQREGPTVEEGPDMLYEPQCIVDEDVRDGNRRYYVKWRGSSRHTWEFEDDLLASGCQELITDWQERHGMATPPLPEVYSVDTDHLLTAEEANSLSRPTRRPWIRKNGSEDVLISERPVAFSSRETTIGEKKLVAIELEASALVWAYLKFLPLIEGCPVHIITDHSPLGTVMKGPSSHVHSPYLLKARQRLAPYVHLLTFHHRAGNTHVNVDALSRLPQAIEKNP